MGKGVDVYSRTPQRGVPTKENQERLLTDLWARQASHRLVFESLACALRVIPSRADGEGPRNCNLCLHCTRKASLSVWGPSASARFGMTTMAGLNHIVLFFPSIRC